ncbi:hypothetical protein QUF74_11030 [Candidatus Halobeggiatoa sp. HSG11]|nr:hypothetical protein [Candidatus Halobeggiatoa sp. HSG11]
MSESFLTEIQITNFKCFDDFKADGFKRVNLIGGKNNVGKIAFMEACYVNIHAQDIKSFVSSLIMIKSRREKLNLLDELLQRKEPFNHKKFFKLSLELNNKICIWTNLNKAFYGISECDGVKKYIFKLNKKTIEVNINDLGLTH